MSATVLFSLTLLYLFPLVLLGLVLTAPRQHPRWLITLVLAALPVFYIGHYEALKAIQGWPSEAALPAEFRLLAFEITEPDRGADHRGEILLWVRDVSGGPARVHRLPYAKALHQALVDAGREQAAGHPQRGSLKPTEQADSANQERRAPSIGFRPDEPPPLPEKEPGL